MAFDMRDHIEPHAQGDELLSYLQKGLGPTGEGDGYSKARCLFGFLAGHGT